jgi:hypothetical protein
MTTTRTWTVRYLDKTTATLRVRTFQSEEAAQLFIQRIMAEGGDVLSWAVVDTRELKLPDLKPKGGA